LASPKEKKKKTGKAIDLIPGSECKLSESGTLMLNLSKGLFGTRRHQRLGHDERSDAATTREGSNLEAGNRSCPEILQRGTTTFVGEKEAIGGPQY